MLLHGEGPVRLDGRREDNAVAATACDESRLRQLHSSFRSNIQLRSYALHSDGPVSSRRAICSNPSVADSCSRMRRLLFQIEVDSLALLDSTRLLV